MKKILPTLVCLLAISSICISQEYPDTIGISKILSQNKIKDFQNEDDVEKLQNLELNASEVSYMSVIVFLISANTNQPIVSGSVSSNPSAEKYCSDITDSDGKGTLELKQNSYEIIGKKTGYESGSKSIGRGSTQIDIELFQDQEFNSKIEILAGLSDKDKNEAAKYLKELKGQYPFNNDLLYYQKLYGLE